MTDNPDETREFTLRETMDYNPQECPECGQMSLYFRFNDAVVPGRPETYQRGEPHCANRACVLNGGRRAST